MLIVNKYYRKYKLREYNITKIISVDSGSEQEML
jgi:hypothetical protein